MTTRLVIPESIERELRSLLMASAPLESGAALLLGTARTDGGLALLVRTLLKAPEDGFRLQNALQWAPTSAWLSRLVGLADEADAGLALVHSHPMSRSASRSHSDRWADELVAPFFSQNLVNRPFASLVLTAEELSGAAWLGGKETSIDEVRVPGTVLRRQVHVTKREVEEPLFERHKLLFGVDGQRRLAALSVAVVGAGGTGSAVCEQLVRLGVGKLLVVDPDVLETSNVTRLYGSTLQDVGSLKVDVVGQSLRSIGSPTEILTLKGDIRERETALRVAHFADVVFGCTDTHSSRAVLNDICYQYMIPTIDIGLRVGMGDRGPTSAAVEVRVLRPDAACLWCYGAIDGRRVAEELMPSPERERLKREGYVQGGEPAATIIPYTTLGASLATARFLSMATGISDLEAGVYVFDAITFEGWSSAPIQREGTCLQRQGLGDARPVWLR